MQSTNKFDPAENLAYSQKRGSIEYDGGFPREQIADDVVFYYT